MDPTLVGSLVQVLSSGGLLAGFVIFIGLCMTKKLVFGWVHEAVIAFYKAQIAEMQLRHDAELAAANARTLEWKDMAVKGIKAFGTAANVAEVLAATNVPPPRS